MPARCPDRVQFQTAVKAPCGSLWQRGQGPRPLLAHAVTQLRDRFATVPGAQWVTTGSEPSVRQSSFPGPTSLPVQVCQAVLERQLRLKVKCVGMSSNYPVSAMLIHTDSTDGPC